MKREDTDPWYRQFWPWFIIALPAFAVVSGLYTVWIAAQTQDSLVVQSGEGIYTRTERNLVAEREAGRLGLIADLEIQPETGAVVVSMSSSPEVDHATSLHLRMRHPTMASRDVAVDLLPALPDAEGDPTWAGHFITPPVGRYYVTLSSGDTWRLSDEWSGQSRFTLSPTVQPDDGQH